MDSSSTGSKAIVALIGLLKLASYQPTVCELAGRVWSLGRIRITDIGLVQGPIMRFFDVEALSIETAGQSAPGSLVQLAGIKDGRKFRDAILKQRDLVVGSEEERGGPPASSPSPPAFADDQSTLLADIRDTLRRIEHQLAASRQ
jgi:hypothetical protein